MFKRFRCKLPMNLQTFAESGSGDGDTGNAGAGGGHHRQEHRHHSLIMTNWPV